MNIPSYLVFNHKTGSVSSNYSTYFNILQTSSTFNFILIDLVDGRQEPLPDDTTRYEGDRDSQSRYYGDEEYCSGESNFLDFNSIRDTIPERLEETDPGKARGTQQIQRGVLCTFVFRPVYAVFVFVSCRVYFNCI